MFSILIVDDERIVLNGVRLLIEEELHLPFPVDIVTASNGPRALELLGHFTPDLILTDIRMPVMDGFALTERIRERLPEVDIAILTSHADFDYAMQAIRFQVTDFILKPINEQLLKETIEKSHARRKKGAEKEQRAALMELRNMMLYDLSPAEMLSSPEQIRALFPDTYFTVAVVRFFEPVPDGAALAKRTEEVLAGIFGRCRCFYLKEKNQAAAICGHAHFLQHTGDLKRRLAEGCGFDGFYLGVSISSNAWDSLHSLYTNAVQRIFYEKNFGENPELAGLSLLTYRDCLQIFTEKDEQAAWELLKNCIQTIFSISPGAAPADVCRSFFHNIAFYLESAEIPMPARKQISCRGDEDPGELARLIHGELLALKAQLWRHSEERGGDAQVRQLLSYIRENYMRDIGLEDLAEHLGMHPNYVCTLFKKNTGQSYLSFLHQERLRAAKKMLSESDLPVESIARQVGYNSASQLARVFRKYESMSPSDFRSKH